MGWEANLLSKIRSNLNFGQIDFTLTLFLGSNMNKSWKNISGYIISKEPTFQNTKKFFILWYLTFFDFWPFFVIWIYSAPLGAIFCRQASNFYKRICPIIDIFEKTRKNQRFLNSNFSALGLTFSKLFSLYAIECSQFLGLPIHNCLSLIWPEQ